MLEKIPVVSLDIKNEETVELLGRAFHDIGFAFVKVPEEMPTGLSTKNLLPWVYEKFERVFNLPEEVKAKYKKPHIHYQRGWTPPFKEKAIGEDRYDSKENWFIGPEKISDETLTARYPDLYAPNVWPEEVPTFPLAMLTLYQDLYNIGRDALRLVARYLERGGDDFFEDMLRDAPTVMRAIYYPPVTSAEVGRVVWGGKHTDINLITVLPPGSAPGLWVRRRDGEWIPGVAPDGCVLVQVADMLQYLTRGYFLSAVHEVRAPESPTDEGRYSAALFVHARSDVLLEPDMQEVHFTPGRVRVPYPPITAGELLRKRLREIGLAAEEK